MNKKHKRRPDYSELYPGVEISEEVLAFLKKSDRKIDYQENDLKRDRYARDKSGKRIADENGQNIKLPELEVSLDKLVDEDWDFTSSVPSPEETVIEQFEIKALYSGLDLLDTEEQALIKALFFEGLTIREYAEITGKSKSSIDRQKTKILGKLKEFLTN